MIGFFIGLILGGLVGCITTAVICMERDEEEEAKWVLPELTESELQELAEELSKIPGTVVRWDGM